MKPTGACVVEKPTLLPESRSPRTKDFFRRSISARDSSVDGPVISVGVGRFPGEKQRRVYALSQMLLGIVAAGPDVAVRSAGKLIVLPVMDVSAYQQFRQFREWDCEPF